MNVFEKRNEKTYVYCEYQVVHPNLQTILVIVPIDQFEVVEVDSMLVQFLHENLDQYSKESIIE